MATTTATVPKSLYPQDPAIQASTSSAIQPAAPAPAPTAQPMPTQETPGLINIQPTGYTPSTAPQGPRSYEAETYQATPDVVSPNETVQHQVNQIVDANSPLMQQAQRIANEQANSRGLLNSSLAVGHGQQAVISSALPIAQQDANTYAAARRATNQSLNEAGQFNAGQINTARGMELEAGNRLDLANIQANTSLEQSRERNMTDQLIANLGARTDLTKTAMSQETQLAIANLDAGVKQFLGQLDANNRQLLQANASAASMFQDVVNNIAKIATDPTIGGAAKEDATYSQLNLLNEALRTMQETATTDQRAIDGLNLEEFFIQIQEPGENRNFNAWDRENKPSPSGLISTRAQTAEEEARQRRLHAPPDYTRPLGETNFGAQG